MADIHPVFHVSQLRRCLREPEKECVPEEEIALQTDLRYKEVPIKILDTITKRTRNSEVRICRVQWSRHGVEEATWEREDALKKEFPHLFRSQSNLKDEIHFKWGRFVMPAFLSYLNYITNHSLKNLLKIFSAAQAPEAHLLIFRHPDIAQSLPLFPWSRPSLFLFHRPCHPVASPSCRSRPRAPARPRSSVPRACPLFYFLIFCSNPFYFSLLILSLAYLNC
jgi:hypothetical protein